ncbi:hypothetical protein ABW20_dc0108162 [Dactylellina cionopaga]|nr:hypothetical protein ABW20_dc0108162 [Dactylellina cionopaga]
MKAQPLTGHKIRHLLSRFNTLTMLELTQTTTPPRNDHLATLLMCLRLMNLKDLSITLDCTFEDHMDTNHVDLPKDRRENDGLRYCDELLEIMCILRFGVKKLKELSIIALAEEEYLCMSEMPDWKWVVPELETLSFDVYALRDTASKVRKLIAGWSRAKLTHESMVAYPGAG